jgi:hypothetical protein
MKDVIIVKYATLKNDIIKISSIEIAEIEIYDTKNLLVLPAVHR